jgi:hypothetical protein
LFQDGVDGRGPREWLRFIVQRSQKGLDDGLEIGDAQKACQFGGLTASVSQNLRSHAARRTIRGQDLIANAGRLGREALRIIRSGMIQSET